MKKQTDTFKRLRAVMKDINGDNRQIIKTMQDQIEYLMEFIAIQGNRAFQKEQRLPRCRLPSMERVFVHTARLSPDHTEFSKYHFP